MAKRLQYMDALGPTIEKAKFAAAGGDVAAEEARLMDPNYIAPGVMEQSTGTLQPYTPTMRENAESQIAGALESLGMSKQSARDSAIGFTGTTDSSRGGMGVGVLDFAAPFSIPTAVQEASREVDRLGNDPNASGVDYIMPAITVGLSVAESLPLAKLATRPLKSFISNLAAKSKAESIAEPLIASAGPMIPRRTFVQGIAATPVAGALSKLPLGKVDEVAKVAKVAKAALPKDFSIFYDLPRLKSQIDEILEGDIKTYDYDFVNPDNLEDVGDDIQDLVDQVSSADRFEVAEAFDMKNDIIDELRDTYKLNDSEIDEILKKEGFEPEVPIKSSPDLSNPPVPLRKSKEYLDDLLKSPENYKVEPNPFPIGRTEYFIEATGGPLKGKKFFEGLNKKESKEIEKWLKSLVKESK